MKINIIKSIETTNPTVEKIIGEMNNYLSKDNCTVTISNSFDINSDINHYCIESLQDIGPLEDYMTHPTSFLITNVINHSSLCAILDLTNNGAFGICLSSRMKDKLISCGVKSNRICYVVPGQDGNVKPRKVYLGFTHRLYNDHRKKNDILIDICDHIDPNYIGFIIMGSGWDNIVQFLKSKGFEVEYYSEFDKTVYNSLFDRIDYYCYFGKDEGSMGYLDAMSAGVKTIITPQGYHLDSGISITYPVNTIDDIIMAITSIQDERKKYTKFAGKWTWERYTLKINDIWNYIRDGNIDRNKLLMSCERDGICSLMTD